MSTMTPAERLLAAADLLDNRSGEATEGPWVNTRDGEVVNAKGWDVVDRYGAGSAEARYIATMHPEVGKAVAVLLRQIAGNVRNMNPAAVEQGCREPLAVADLVLAGE